MAKQLLDQLIPHDLSGKSAITPNMSISLATFVSGDGTSRVLLGSVHWGLGSEERGLCCLLTSPLPIVRVLLGSAIVDNLSAHKTQQVRTFLVAHPSVHLHYTPTYSSWLNQVELWFSKIERDVTARGIFTSVTDLRRKLMRYIKHYNKTATPIRWSYADPSRRIA